MRNWPNNIIIVLVLAAMAGGQTIGIDFAGYGNSSGAGAETNFVLINGNVSDVQAIDADNGADVAGVTITVTGILGVMGESTIGYSQVSGGGDYNGTQYSDLSYNDGIYFNNVVTVTFSGLNDALTYDFTAANNAGVTLTDTRQVTVAADGRSFTTNSAVTANAAGGYVLNPVIFNGLSTDGSGHLVITFTDVNHAYCGLGGMTLTFVDNSIASGPTPDNGQEYLVPYVNPAWTPVVAAQSQRLYFGTNSASLSLQATLSGTAAIYDQLPSPLQLNTEYFWRIDTFDGSQWQTGALWSFTTRAAEKGDADGNYGVDMEDLRRLAQNWLEMDCRDKGWCQGADFDYSNKVDLDDFVILSQNWQQYFDNPYTDEVGLPGLIELVEDLQGTFEDDYTDGPAMAAQIDTYQQTLHAILADMKNGDPTYQQRLDDLKAEITAFMPTAVKSNPMIKNHPILFVTRGQYVRDHHNSATFFPSYDSELNTGYYTGGGALKKIDFANGGQVTTLINLSSGIVRDPEVYFDGSRILYSKRINQADSYHLYEIAPDGSGEVQLTTAIRVDDLDPMYLPDDNIIFSSTREPKYVHCNRHIMANLFKMEPDGANIHQISNNTLFDMHGSLTDDGRVMYTRWEYVDRNFGDAQGIWTCLPDGRNHAVYFGNNTISPGAMVDPRQIPGTNQVVCIFSSCHDRPWGALAVVDRRLGVDLPQPGKPNPVKYIWPESAIDLCGGWDGTKTIPLNYGGAYGFDNMMAVNPKYEDPFPLYDPNHPDSTGKYFLVSRVISGEKTGIYVVDIFGNETLLHEEADGRGCYDPMPIAVRPRPAVLPDLRKYGDENGDMQNGKFYLVNAYEGTHMAGIASGQIKYLRVLEATEKLTWTSPAWNGQGQEAPGVAWHDFYAKQILGTVPIEADGSAYFEVPSETPVYFQLLDADGKMVQSMRSLTLTQPGEMIGCVGCHEQRTDAVPVADDNSYLPLATQRGPDTLNGWYGPVRRFNYLEEVQPVLTANCASCHGFDTPGGAKGGLLLEPDKTPYFNTSYNELWRKGCLTVPGAGFAPIMQARSWGSHASDLIDALESNPAHANLNLTAEEKDRIITWVDINAPYYPYYTSAYRDNAAGRSPLTNTQLSDLSSLTGYSFAQKAAPSISFDRPEKSQCLQWLSGASYSQALAIIQQGQTNLTNNPRADMDGHVPSATDQMRIDKYLMRQSIEMDNREAIRLGTKLYDADHAN